MAVCVFISITVLGKPHTMKFSFAYLMQCESMLGVGSLSVDVMDTSGVFSIVESLVEGNGTSENDGLSVSFLEK